MKPVNTDSKSGVKTTENDAVESKNFRPSHSLVADKLAAGKALQVIVDHGYQSTVVVVSSDEERASESGKLREEVVVYV